jgi:hypothetical protein
VQTADQTIFSLTLRLKMATLVASPAAGPLPDLSVCLIA